MILPCVGLRIAGSAPRSSPPVATPWLRRKPSYVVRSATRWSRSSSTRACQRKRLIADGHAEGIAVARLDRLSRSLADIVTLAAWLDANKLSLRALDVAIDTS